MKHWQVIVIVLLMAAATAAVIVYPPGTHVVRQLSVLTPAPVPKPQAAEISLLFAGDIMLSRSVGELMATRNDWRWPFEHIASMTRSADLMFANLETTVSTNGIKTGCGYCFHSDPRVMQGLVYAGVDLVSVANNHVWDYGPVAFTDTLGYLATNNISAVGGGHTLAEARTPVVRTVGTTRVAYLAYTDLLPASAGATESSAGANLWDQTRMTEDITRARALADVVVVAFHTGTEYETTHNPTQEFIYRAAIDSGADLVVGSHPHVVQELEHYKQGWIAYSLGNFVFDQNFSDATEHGAMLSATVSGGKVTGAALIPVSISAQYQVSVAP